MAVRIDITVSQSIEIAYRSEITVLQSIEMAVRRVITVSQSLYRYIQVRYNCVTESIEIHSGEI